MHLPKCVKRFLATCSRAWSGTKGDTLSASGVTQGHAHTRV